MKKIWIAAILAAAATGARAAEPDIVVFVHAGNESPIAFQPAERQAHRMLARVGLSVAWHMGSPNYQGPAEVIEVVLTSQRDERFQPGALAYANIGQQSGTRIVVFYNRIRGEAHETDPAVLAYVLVHEITHIVEGVARHSATGIMKARWDLADRRRIRSYSLDFSDDDAQMINAWVDRHRRVLLAGMR